MSLYCHTLLLSAGWDGMEAINFSIWAIDFKLWSVSTFGVLGKHTGPSLTPIPDTQGFVRASMAQESVLSQAPQVNSAVVCGQWPRVEQHCPRVEC